MAMDDHSSGDFDLSESPQKEDKPRGNMRQRVGSRPPAGGAGTKRASSEPGEKPRARASPWPDDKRAVHRRVKIDQDASTTSSLQGIGKQLDADREHMLLLN